VRHSRCTIRFLLPAILTMLATVAVHASRVPRVSLEHLTRQADRIFSGRCVDVRVMRDPVLGQEVTQVTFEVQRGVKGAVHGRVTIRMLGDQRLTRERGRGTHGVPRFQDGEELVLFLYGDSRSGLTSPVAFGNGKFTVVTDSKGSKRAVNAFDNEGLFRGLSQDALRRLGGSPARWKGREGVAPDALLDMVSVLIR